MLDHRNLNNKMLAHYRLSYLLIGVIAPFFSTHVNPVSLGWEGKLCRSMPD